MHAIVREHFTEQKIKMDFFLPNTRLFQAESSDDFPAI